MKGIAIYHMRRFWPIELTYSPFSAPLPGPYRVTDFTILLAPSRRALLRYHSHRSPGIRVLTFRHPPPLCMFSNFLPYPYFCQNQIPIHPAFLGLSIHPIRVDKTARVNKLSAPKERGHVGPDVLQILVTVENVVIVLFHFVIVTRRILYTLTFLQSGLRAGRS